MQERGETAVHAREISWPKMHSRAWLRVWDMPLTVHVLCVCMSTCHTVPMHGTMDGRTGTLDWTNPDSRPGSNASHSNPALRPVCDVGCQHIYGGFEKCLAGTPSTFGSPAPLDPQHLGTPQHLRCWGQSTSQIHLAPFLETKGRDGVSCVDLAASFRPLLCTLHWDGILLQSCRCVVGMKREPLMACVA